MFPAKMATKNNAVINPTTPRYFLKMTSVVIKDKPSAISTKPDVITTKSGSSGNQVELGLGILAGLNQGGSNQLR